MSRPREFDVDRALCQSMEMFWTKGFKSTSFEDLTRTTQVKKQSLYGVFKDKRELFLKALALYREQSVAMLEELASQEVSPLQKLKAICDAALYPNEEAMRRGCFMVNTVLEFGADDQEINREAELMYSQVERILEKVIRSGQERQLITTRQSSKELAAFLNNALSGAKVMEKSGASREQIDEVLRTTFALIAPENAR
ncbi:TetR/AcrR family transcriptional regulator [Brevibacillus migulae]|uniref:TetR/AcrR family transcriptional regulator n=1 Tax=Brevibacillus migulae TaxID=1644114 RepID=UPI00106E9796|nr:TetR/AcrR family transcriptional regulator [Brevibacillus migulae]